MNSGATKVTYNPFWRNLGVKGIAEEEAAKLRWGVKLAIYQIVATAVLWIPFARCQTADTAFPELQNKIKGHKYLLKNFSAQPTTLYHLSGDRLEADSPPPVKTVALFSPTELTLNGTILTIRGQRFGLLLDRNTNTLPRRPSPSKLLSKST